MHPDRVDRNNLKSLTDLPNVGKAIAKDLRLIDVERPDDLRGKDPFALYQKLCEKTGTRHDPCMIDVFISLTRFMDGEEPRPWWKYTAERKQVTGKM